MSNLSPLPSTSTSPTNEQTNPDLEKQLLLTQLQTLVEKCETRFCNRYELATENDSIVNQLCQCIERAFNHGLIRQQSKIKLKSNSPSGNNQESNFLNKTSSKLLNGLNRMPQDSTFNCLWNFIQLYLTEHEVRRFNSLRNVHTDYGRGRSWIRNALNEHSLERNILIIFEDRLGYRSKFYHDWALIQDERCLQLITATQGLSSVLFAFNIDNPLLDQVDSNPESKSDDNSDRTISPLPSSSTPKKTVTTVTKRKSTNIIKLDDDMVDMDSDQDIDIYARSAPTINKSFLSMASSSAVRDNPIDALSPLSKLQTSLIASKSNSSLSISNSDNVVLFPINDSEPSDNHQIQAERVLYEKLNYLERENERINRDNSLLKIQLNKYCAALELLKYRNNGLGINANASISTNECTSGNDSNNEAIASIHTQKDIEHYEKKLIEVSQMHGELVEFNSHLYRVIQQKESIISRLRDELVELRGPLPDHDEILSVTSETADNNSIASIQIPAPLIHVWIPTAFLSGGFKGKSHHIYQIYIRIKEEEWNVYRRYSQFHSLNRTLKTKYSCIGQYEFPPKKAIGNKDSKVVQERRKKLEFYLRNVINYMRTQMDLSNKEKLVSAIPFLSDKFFIQDSQQQRSRSESNLANTQLINNQPSQSSVQSQQQSDQHYMGF